MIKKLKVIGITKKAEDLFPKEELDEIKKLIGKTVTESYKPFGGGELYIDENAESIHSRFIEVEELL